MMKKELFMVCCFSVTLFLCAAPPAFTLQNVEKRTASGVTVVYPPGTEHEQGGFEFLRELDRELSRLFRAPPGTGGCRIVIDRDFAGTMEIRVRRRVREIRLPEKFMQFSQDPEFRGELASQILAARFGITGRIRPLPGWIVFGMEGIRMNARSAGRIVSNQQYYPVLRGLLGYGVMPDFRALMQQENCKFTGAAHQAVCEFGRFLLETFAGLSSLRNNALGDYAAGMLKALSPEPDIYQASLLPAMTGGRRAPRTEKEFFRLAATRAAFNARTPCPAADLLKKLPEVLQFSVPSSREQGKFVRGKITDLPALFAEKSPDALAAQLAIRQNLQFYMSQFSPEVLAAGGELQSAVHRLTGDDPEAERAAILRGQRILEERLKRWMQVEQYLERCETQFVRPGLLFQPELSTVSEDHEFLSPAGKAFFDQVEKKYLEH